LSHSSVLNKPSQMSLVLGLGLSLSLILSGCESLKPDTHSVVRPVPVPSKPVEPVALSHPVAKPQTPPFVISAGRRAQLAQGGIKPLGLDQLDNYVAREESDLKQKLEPLQVQIVRRGYDLIITIPGDQMFVPGSVTINASTYGTLNQIAASMGGFSSTYADILGHADGSGSETENHNLSEKRAQATASYLVSHNIAFQRLFIAGAGSKHPIASNDTPEGRAKNRRIEIILRPFI